jgi:DNA polymerase elongation subunit (family B)
LTYNGRGYDWGYVYARAKSLGVDDHLQNISKFLYWPCKWREIKLETNAVGKSYSYFVDSPGMIDIDIMKIMEKLNLVELADIKLNTVAKYYLGEKNVSKETIFQRCTREGDTSIGNIKKVFEESLNSDKKGLIHTKEDLDYEDMYRYFEAAVADPEAPESKRKTYLIAKYNIQDCVLLHNIMKKAQFLTTLTATAVINRYCTKEIYQRGVGVLITSVISMFAKQQGYLYQDIPYVDQLQNELLAKCNQDPVFKAQFLAVREDPKKRDTFIKKFAETLKVKGGNVFEPKPSNETEVTTFDVASEYPSIMSAPADDSIRIKPNVSA